MKFKTIYFKALFVIENKMLLSKMLFRKRVLLFITTAALFVVLFLYDTNFLSIFRIHERLIGLENTFEFKIKFQDDPEQVRDKDGISNHYGVRLDANKVFELNTIDNNFSKAMNYSYYELDYSPNHATHFQSDDIEDSEMDLILVWTDFFNFKFLYQQEPNGDLYIYPRTKDIHRPAYCEKLYPNCRVTSNRKYLNKSSLLVFHRYDINLDDFPAHRSAEQLWIFYGKESPAYSRLLPNSVNVLFNGTANYHSASADILIPYGEVQRRDNPTYKPDIFYKSLPIIWLVSHCSTTSRREEYSRELERYINIDKIGKCSRIYKKGCGKRNFEECQRKLYSKYYFYFAAENAFCDEYITEKTFSTLKWDIVPIVYGGANYTRFLPPHSFIDATKYQPKELATLLKNLMTNNTAYLEYFEWKKHFIVQNDRHGSDHMFCEACRYVQLYKKGEIRRKSISMKQINEYWFSTCWDSSRIDNLLQFYKEWPQTEK